MKATRFTETFADYYTVGEFDAKDYPVFNWPRDSGAAVPMPFRKVWKSRLISPSAPLDQAWR
jgi:hypothetical protein